MSTKKQRMIAAVKLRKRPPGALKEIPVSEWPKDHPTWMARALRNNRYTVMIEEGVPTDKGPAIRAMIQAHDALPIKNHWSVIQGIKNEVFGPEVTGIEYYPKESQLVNFHNVYWLWVFPDGILPKL